MQGKTYLEMKLTEDSGNVTGLSMDLTTWVETVGENTCRLILTDMAKRIQATGKIASHKIYVDGAFVAGEISC